MSYQQASLGAVTITLMLLAPTETNADSQSTKAAEAANTPCKAVLFMEKLAASLQTKLAAEMEKAKARTDEAAELAVAAAAAEQDNKRLGYNILRAIALQAQAKQMAQLKQLDAVYAPAVTQLVNLSTRLRQAAMANKRIISSRGTPTHGAAPANGATNADASCKYAGWTQTLGDINCKEETELTGDLATANIQAEGLTKIPYPNTAFLNSLAADITAFSKGTPTNANTGSQTWVCSSGADAAVGTIGQSHAIGTLVQPTAVEHGLTAIEITGANKEKNCKGPEQGTSTEERAKAVFLSAICNLAAVATESIGSALATTTTGLKSGAQAATIVKAAMQGAGLLSSDANNVDKAALEKFISSTFGPSDKAVEDDFIAPLDKVKLNYIANNKETTETPTAIAQGKNVAVALAFFSGKALKTGAIKNTKPDIGSKPTEKCKPDTKENEYKKDEDCEHKDGKCKLKEGVKVENDGKTNTTARNSFVINKAPLLLAVLLL
ncbi:variant surface glycoprotein (VSG), putative [Trypanosoma equiperdum]|uniref:Variant surface glycoprotein (VSG), putative n=3 Tax=Trypanozoon TaxID=39700 RepID=Q380W3_TRYB2|nr:variant surface glycoprotein [Trypanosoma brucei brucei TREU927]EAN80668.1 variant surface glycoprotein (VSG), putative [Trypanosoma brucei brucei TREU927]SCU70591.1 variant surface glycoprotein (VSG), putative [Trypanosoma equiperdum]